MEAAESRQTIKSSKLLLGFICQDVMISGELELIPKWAKPKIKKTVELMYS